MTDERTELISSVGSGLRYGSNSSYTREASNVKNNPIKQLWKEISSGRQRLHAVLLYSIIAAFGSCITGFVLGFSSLLNINMDKYHFPIPSEKDVQFIGVSNLIISTIIIINYYMVYNIRFLLYLDYFESLFSTK